jgi:hypothetical protein
MDYLESAKKSLFRWEALQEYRVDDEDDMDDWWAFLQKKSASGVVLQRVRMIRFPLNDYTKKELQVHAMSNMHGDDIRVIEDLEVRDCLQDFWLVDDAVVISMKYGNGGEYLGFEVSTVDIDTYRSFRDAVWTASGPLSELEENLH